MSSADFNQEGASNMPPITPSENATASPDAERPHRPYRLKGILSWIRRGTRTPVMAALAALVFLGLVGATALWTIFGPNTTLYSGERGIKIPPGSNFGQVIDSLRSADILASAATLRALGTATGWGGQVKAGHYTFRAGASNYTILNKIRKGLQTPVRLLIPPGTRPEVMAQVAARQMYFPPEAFAAALRDSALARELGTDVPHLLGYMMPETYSFYWLSEAPTVVRKIKESFDAFYERELAAGARNVGLSKDQVVAMASIIEWETAMAVERPRVAGVYLNRMKIGMPLQADPTVQFIVMQREGKKRRLLHQDLQIDSPFNTYRYAGLPPAPITNPSPSALRAAVGPESHDYLYFVAKGDGSHTFSRSYSEHLVAARAYYQLMQQRRADMQ